MTLLFADSCEHLNSASHINSKWSSGIIGAFSSSSTTHFKTGARSYQSGGSSGFYTHYNKGGAFNGSVVFVQCHFKITVLTGEICLLAFTNTSDGVQSSLWLNKNMQFEVRRGLTAAVVAASSYVPRENIWHYLEVKWTVADSISSNSIIIKVNGIEVLNPSSGDTADTANTTVQYVRVYAATPLVIFWDNFLIMDNTGSVMNDLQGEIFIEALFPNGNGTYSAWVGNDGNQVDNYLLVDETLNDDATTYVQSNNVGDKDSYAFSDIVSSTPTVKAVASNMRLAKQSTTARSIKHFTRISNTDYEHTSTYAVPGISTWFSNQIIWVESPATVSAWTKSEIDGAQFGVKVQA